MWNPSDAVFNSLAFGGIYLEFIRSDIRFISKTRQGFLSQLHKDKG